MPAEQLTMRDRLRGYAGGDGNEWAGGKAQETIWKNHGSASHCIGDTPKVEKPRG